jgi:hypothetical protein
MAPMRREPIAAAWLTLGIAAFAPAIADDLSFAAGWETAGQSTIREGVLEVGSGRATRRDVALRDGTIELDVEVSGKRSFVYLLFRMADDESYEELYLRPHKSGLPDALQYSPVFHGISSWQLYHGPGYTAAVEIPEQRWIHLCLAIEGAHAAVFIGEDEVPELVIPLVREPRPGYVSVRGFVPEGSPTSWSARFKGFKVEPGAAPVDFSRAEPPRQALPGTIRSWAVSGTFVPEEGKPVESIPAAVAAGPWTELQTEGSGLLLMSRDRGLPPDAEQWAVLARTTLDADRAGVKRLELGYSDEVSVFLNGRLLFVADDSYSFDRPRREGLIGLDQAAIYLPLEPGTNELTLAVTDRFGGWGWMARLP